MIYLCSDHGGYDLKNLLLEYLESQGLEVKNMGPFEYQNDDDYPDYVNPTMVEMQKNLGSSKAIVICRNGVGVCVAANKYKGIRCALSWMPQHAASSRIDDDSNVLALPADYVSDEDAKIIVDTWLQTEFSNEPRHIRRLEKVSQILN